MKKPLILFVDDDLLLLNSIQGALKESFDVLIASNRPQAEGLLKSNSVDCVLLDLGLGEVKGQDLIADWRQRYPELEIVVLSGQTEVRLAIDCMRRGAADYLVKPMEPEQVQISLERALDRRRLKNSLEKLEPLIRPVPISFIGSSTEISEVIEKAKLLKNKTQLNVLILGESGTGKEVLARFLHQQEEANSRPFVIANMPAIPSTLMEAELFGVEKGAFTDAKTSRPGKFELADGGDIFLDEIGDLPLEMQSKLLRTLQEHQIQRVGSNRTLKLSFRVISATNQSLSKMISEGKFREDLMYRLSDVVLWLPPLRERKSDIPFLLEHFIRKHQSSGPTPQVTQSALKQLIQYDWPGNIRQLESCVKRALVFSRGGVIDQFEFNDLRQPNPFLPSRTGDLQSQVRQYERKLIEEAIQQAGGNKNQAMSSLGLTRATFYRKINELGAPTG